MKTSEIVGQTGAVIVTDYAEAIAELSPEKQELLQLLLREQASGHNSFPLSFAQQRLWFMDQLEPGSFLYNICTSVRIEGRLNLPALQSSFNEIVRRHETLRTTFGLVDGQPVQVIAGAADVTITFVDFRELPAGEKDDAIQRLLFEEARLPFDLTQGPLLRVKLVGVAAEEHVLLICMHHIISDGWSLGVLVRELAALYQSFSKEQPSALPELPIQYTDFVLWQREFLQGEVLVEHLEYWKKQLAGAPGVLDLPADRPRPAINTYRGAKQSFVLSNELSAAIRNLSEESEGATLFMTLVAAFQTLLYRYTGQEDIVIGTPIANRNRAETEGLIGFFVNTLLLRTSFAGNPSFQELLRRVREVALGAYAHQDLPFEKLVEELQPERSLSNTPLFQVAFFFQNAVLGTLDLPGLRLTPLPGDNGTAKFDLTLTMEDTDRGLVGVAEYNTDLFDDDTIERLLGHYQTLLQGIVDHPQHSVNELPLLTSEEQRQLSEWNATDTVYRTGAVLHEIFESQAERTPHAVAVVFQNQQLTYEQLDQRANQLAHHLRSLGVTTEARVGVMLERSPLMVIGLLAVLKAGGAYVPLDPHYPRQRVLFMLENAQVQVLLTESALADAVSECAVPVVCVDRDEQQIAAASSANPGGVVYPENLAYVIYTSGSTGTPKGVQITHQAIVNFLSFMEGQLRITEQDILLAVTSLSFDIAVLELFLPLTVGARVVLLTGEQSMDAAALSEQLAINRVSLMQATPVTWRMLTEFGWKPPEPLKILCGGEALSGDLAQQLANSGNELWNLYGPTETTVWSLTKQIEAREKRVTIGRPMANTQVYVVDQRLNAVPVGIPGELYIGGDGLARGYLDRAELTAERFVPDPFSLRAGRRLYRTGDLVRYLANGELEYLGRMDQQVKLRGFRIELGEIEAALLSESSVREAVVIAREDSPGEKRLVAYVVLHEELQTSVTELLSALQEKLPNYMIPSAFVVLKALPLTNNGKLNRRALPPPDGDRSNLEPVYVAPGTPTEKRLADIWAETLGVNQVGIHDNFFQLGGHSLRAIQILSRVRANLNVEVPLRTLFQTPTVAGLAAFISTKLSSPAPQLETIKPVSRQDLLRLSFAQQRLWFFNQLEPGSWAYNLPLAVRLTGQLDVQALERTLSEIVRRHEALRTTFSVVDDTPIQLISAPFDVPLNRIDLSALTKQERETEARLLAEHESRRPFDLSRGPLLRAMLIKLSEQEHIAWLTMHHIISDAWSMDVLVREVVSLYEAYVRGEQSPLTELSVQYADYAAWQRERLQGEVLEDALSYWREQLSGAPRTLELPTDRPRSARQSYRGSRLNFEINEELTEKLRELSQREGATLFMVLLAAWQFLLSRYSGQQDIVVGVTIANRNHVDIENLIGFFINTLALRVRVAAEENFLQLLARVREVTLAAYEHQELPFERVVEELQPERYSGFQPLFQVMFVYQNVRAASHELPELTLGHVEMSDEAAVRSDIDFYLSEGESLRGSFVYSTDLFDKSTVAQMSNRLLELLEEIARAPETSLTDLLVSAQPDPLDLALTRVEEEEKAPFSYHQERLWFIDQFENGNVYESAPTYHNIPLILHLNGHLDLNVLQSSLNEILARHAVLRTRFISEEGRGYQVITPSERLELKVVQSTELQGPRALSEIVELALIEAREPFALDRDLPIRATIFCLSDTETLLVLTVHHIAADRPSLRLITAELAEIYNARIEGRAAFLPELPIQYARYAKSQQDLTEADFEQLWFYWKWQLRGQLAALNLPEDRPRPAIHTYTAGRETFTVDATLVHRLAERACEDGSNQFAVMLAVFKVLLHRYARQDEIVVGASEPCRPQLEVANVVGPFANLVVLRSDLGGNPSFSTLVRRLEKTVAQARAHQELPFDKLVQLLNPEKDMSRTALFDVLFQFDNEAEPVLLLGQTRARQIDTNFGYGKYDLNLLVRRSAEGFTVTAVYNADIYDAWHIRQMLGHFEVLINALAANPEQRIDDVTLLSTTEERQQLSGWNDTHASYPTDKTIHQLFAEQVTRSPEKTAVTFGEDRLTYRELDERANRLAHYLRRQGVGRNQLVALCLNKSPEMIVSLLAVLKAGGAYLPLEPANPAERLQFVMEDSAAAHLITTASLAGNVPLAVPATVLLDKDHEAILSEPSTAPDTGAGPQDLAYCIYTSGSTGKPKGALIEHGNVVRLMVNDRLQFTFTSNDVWTMVHSYAFDFSVWEMYGALLHGGRLVVVPEQVAKDPALFLDLLIAEQVTVLNQTPTAFYNLTSLDPGAGLGLRYVIFGGEALRPALLREWRAAHPEVKLINMYGITETTVHVTFKEIDDEDISRDASNIGVPIPTTTTYIFDDQLRLLPVGVPGEICVGGGGVCRGYLGRDELTRQKFVVNPYKPEETIYRSGDLGKLLPSGEMVYMGRSDDQVQIRGFRVEPGEVQSQLLTHPSIIRAEVIAKTMHHGAVELVAYVVASRNLDVTELRAHVARALPHYMVPSAFVFVDEMPLTPNGKVDQRALPEPDQMRPELDADFVAPRTPTEEILTSIWGEVLGLARVGVQDSFFELGGHSLLATQVISRIRTVFNLELPLRNLFERPTVAEFAASLEDELRNHEGWHLPPIEAVPRDGDLPLSFAQERLWFMDQWAPGKAFYNISEAVRLSGPLNVEALSDALNEIVRRHEALRTKFVAVEGQAVQVIAPGLKLPLPLIDLQRLPEAAREARVLEMAREESQRPFDLSQWPLLRCVMVRLSGEEHVVLFTMHHIISDGWSIGVFVREVAKLYQAFTAGQPSVLPEVPIQYADFAHWQRNQFEGAAFNAQLDYWQRQLAGAPSVLELRTDRPRRAEKNFGNAKQPLEVTAPLVESLKTVGRQTGSTLFMTLLAAFQVLLRHHSGTEDIVVGTDLANRNRIEVENLIGFFINELALRTSLSGNPSFAELLQRVREVTLGAYAHQDMPFDRLVEALKVERNVEHTPLFQVKFVFQNAPMSLLDLPNLRVQVMGNESGATRVHLQLTLWEALDSLKGWLEYNAQIFDATTISRLSSDFFIILEKIVGQPDIRLSELDQTLTDADRERQSARVKETQEVRSQKFRTIRRKAVTLS